MSHPLDRYARIVYGNVGLSLPSPLPLFLMWWLVAQYYFEGRYDLVRFIKLVKQAGLYVHLRIGPYVCAEWNFG